MADNIKPSLPTAARLKRAAADVAAVRSIATHHPEQLQRLGWSEFMAAVQLLTPQSYGNHIEAYLLNRFGWDKLSRSLDRGDAFCAEVGHIEVKVSLITDHNPVANFVQIRPHQELDAYCLVVVDTRTPEFTPTVFWLTAEEMLGEIESCGMVAHGARRNAPKRREWVIRHRWDTPDERLERWYSEYLSDLSAQLEP